MATNKEMTTEQRLKAIYELQTILTNIDKIKTVRGELPLEVKDLEDEIEGLKTRIQKFKDNAEELRKNIAKQNNDILTAKADIDKYTAQQNDVRNNKEYDFLAKEINFKGLEIELCEKRIREHTEQAERIENNIAAAQEQLEDREHILTDKKKELDEIISETRQDEEKLYTKAKAIESKIDDERLLQAFKRIRRNARNGLGVVTVERTACGGCFNRIPAQRQMEIKMHKKIIVCEYCGRIMIDPELAGIEEN